MFISKSLLGGLVLSLFSCSTAAVIKHRDSSSNSNGSLALTWSNYTQDLFNKSMAWMDEFYDPLAGYLFDTTGTTPLRHETRQSVFYALGLLARNQNDDLEQAYKIFYNTISKQFTDPSQPQYGDYQNYAEQPEFSSYYPAVGQKSFFPISRSTNGLAFATALEEFPDLLDDNLTEALSNSIKINLASNYTPTLGFEQTSYALMTAVLACYGGQKFSIEYALDQGNLLADQIISNYDLYNTIPEFNSPDFLSFVIWPLAFAAKHLGNTTDSVPLNIGERAQGMISGIWNQTSQFYHAQLRNLAGPWERVFGFDMTRTHTTLSSYIWAMFGQEHSPAYRATPVNPLYKVTDIANDAFICIYFDYQNAFISDDVRAAFNTFPGDHSVQTAAYLPSVDGSPRLISAWLGANISIGTESINETALGGPFPVESTYVPAAIQWSTGGLGGTEIGAIILAQTETQMDITVQPHLLNISYPAANESSTFEFHVLSFYDGRTVGSWYDLRGLEVDVTTNMANSNYTVGFAGGSGGSGGSPVDGYEFWNFTYSLPQGYSSDDNGPAWIALEPYVDGSLQAS